MWDFPAQYDGEWEVHGNLKDVLEDAFSDLMA
jgi:hypothetical protein